MPREYSANRLSGYFAVACIAVAVLLLGNPSFSNASLPVNGITDPVIAIQTARSIKDIDYVLGESPSPDREVMRIKERIGIGFAIAYGGLLLTLSLGLLRSGGIGRVLAPAAMVTSLGAAGFNIASNLAVLRLLDVNLFGTTSAMVNSIRSPAFVAWALAALALLFLSVYFFRTPRVLARITGALFVITGLMQMYGLRDGQFLVLASAPAAVALVLIAARLLPAFGKKRQAI